MRTKGKDEPGWGGAREGAGRKTLYKEEKKRVNFILPIRVIDKIALCAKSLGISRSDFVTKVIDENID